MAFSKRTLTDYYAYAIIILYALTCSTSTTLAWSPIKIQNQEQFYNYVSSAQPTKTVTQNNEISPYVDLVLCPVREVPWSCARQQSARILDLWDNDLYAQWQKFKVEADRELNATLEKRGYSGSEIITNEKPSTILKKIEIGTNYLKDFLSNNINGYWSNDLNSEDGSKNGIAKVIVQHDHNNVNSIQNKEQIDKDVTEDEDEEEEEEGDDDEDEEYNVENHAMNDPENKHGIVVDSKKDNIATTEGEVEFFEINEAQQGNDDNEDVDDDNDDVSNGQLKRPGGGGKRRKNKTKKKKGQQNDGGVQAQPATILLLQQPSVVEENHDHGGAGTEEVHVSSGHDGGKPNKLKRKKDKRQKRRKNKHQHQHEFVSTEDDLLSSLLEGHGGSSGLELLENLSMDDWLVDGGKRKKGYPSKYGRSNGVTRGKKKKKKKALMKLVLLGSFLKAKIELLLKILGAHLQIKFFAIALIGLLINIARFWIDVKRGGAPQKVVYVEHAHHQHHYEDHGEDWNEPGGYWKRSLHTDTTPEGGSATDSYLPQDDAHFLAYRNSNPQWQ